MSIREVPDRASVDPSSPYFEPMAHRLHVALDDQVLSRCVEACVSEGWARVMKVDEAGRIVHVGGEIQFETLKGRVELSWLPMRKK